MIITRRLAGLAVVGVAVSMAVAMPAAPAEAAVTGPISNPQVANTTTSVAETMPTDTLAVLLTVPAAQLQGPGTHTETDDTYAGTTPVVTPTPPGCLLVLCTGSSVATGFNLDPAGLPAAPGSYTFQVCALTCAVPSLLGDTTTLSVTGAAPTPDNTGAAAAIAPGASGAVDIPGTGFAKLDSLSLVRPGATPTDVVFTESDPTSTASDLKGSLAVNAAVPPGVYDLLVTDTVGQTGVCSGCLDVTAASPVGPNPVTNLTASATSGTTGTASWTASTGAVSYGIVVSTTSTTTTDSGVTAPVTGTQAAISGLTPGTSYFVSVTASDGTNSSAPTVTSLLTPHSTTLTMTVPKNKIVAGATVKLKGELDEVGGSNTPLAHQSIKIYGKPDTSHTSPLGIVQTTNNGLYSFSVKPTQNTTYVAYYNGQDAAPPTPGDSKVFSNAPRIVVSPKVVANAKAAKTSVTKPLVVTGHVTPSESGQTVFLGYLDASSHRHKLATATLSSTSHFRFSTPKPTKIGSYTLVVTVRHHPGHAGGASAHFKVKRTR